MVGMEEAKSNALFAQITTNIAVSETSLLGARQPKVLEALVPLTDKGLRGWSVSQPETRPHNNRSLQLHTPQKTYWITGLITQAVSVP